MLGRTSCCRKVSMFNLLRLVERTVQLVAFNTLLQHGGVEGLLVNKFSSYLRFCFGKQRLHYNYIYIFVICVISALIERKVYEGMRKFLKWRMI